jgi:hypothetical protein
MNTTRPVLLIDYDVTFDRPLETVNFCGVFKDEEYFHKFASDAYNFSSKPHSHKVNKITKGTAEYLNGLFVKFAFDK